MAGNPEQTGLFTTTAAVALGPPNWCDVDRQLGLFYWNYLQPIAIGFMVVALCPLLYYYILAYKEGEFKKSGKGSFYTGLVFFIFIILSEIFYIPCLYYYCWDPTLNNVFGILVTQGYAIQTIMLLGIWSHRLYTILEATKFKIHYGVIIAFIIMYIITSISFATGGIFFQLFLQSFGPFLFSLGFILVLIMSSFLVIIFIIKVFQTYQKTKDNISNPKLIKLITKISLLTFISTTFVILSSIASLLLPIVNSPHMIMMFTWALSIDMFSNFLCIYLSYASSHKLYIKLCKCCDRKCFAMWNKCANKDGIEREYNVDSSIRLSVKTKSTTSVMGSQGSEATEASSPAESSNGPTPAEETETQQMNYEE